MSKQDGYAARTVADLERKYNFGQSFADVYGLATGAQNAADNAQNAADNAQKAADEARKAADEAQAAFDGLNQEQIFNLLTNFGEAQGIYRDENGDVYVNASYIKSGTLSGNNLKVAAGIVEGELTAATIKAEKISGGELDFNKVTAKNLVVGAASIETALKASTIEASQIKGGTLDFSLVTTKNLVVDAANVKGTLSAATISASKISGGTLDFDSISVQNLTVGAATITGTLTNAKISATRVTAGTLDASTIELSAGYGGFGVATGHYTDPDGSSGTTYGAKVFGTSPSSTYLIVTGSGVRMQSSGANFFVSGSVIKASTTIEEGSDRRMKQDISYGVEKYRTFLRKLKPTLYRYKADPTSPMLCGFIAQDVEAALTECGLTRQDFDGIRGGELNDETGEPSTYGLAYSQFVALLTDAVQDIYSRLETVENNLGG